MTIITNPIIKLSKSRWHKDEFIVPRYFQCVYHSFTFNNKSKWKMVCNKCWMNCLHLCMMPKMHVHAPFLFKVCLGIYLHKSWWHLFIEDSFFIMFPHLDCWIPLIKLPFISFFLSGFNFVFTSFISFLLQLFLLHVTFPCIPFHSIFTLFDSWSIYHLLDIYLWWFSIIY